MKEKEINPNCKIDKKKVSHSKIFSLAFMSSLTESDRRKMKKRNAVIMIVIIILIPFFSYIIFNNDSDNYDYNENLESENENIEMKIINVSNSYVEINLINQGQTTFKYTDYFVVRQYKNGEWKCIKFKDDVGFAKCVRELPVKSSKVVTIKWLDYFKHKLPKGKYRIEWVHILDFEI